jgi:hypothetical protein
MEKSPQQLAEELADAILKIAQLQNILFEILAAQEFDGGGHITKLNHPSHSQVLRARELLA